MLSGWPMWVAGTHSLECALCVTFKLLVMQKYKKVKRLLKCSFHVSDKGKYVGLIQWLKKRIL